MYFADVPKCVIFSVSAKLPQHAAAVDEGRAVVQQQRRARGQARHEPVPHHPAAGREVEQAVARLHVAVQQVLLQVLQQRAAGAVHDALGHARRARRVQDVERMIERQLRVVDRTRRRTARATRPTATASRTSPGRRIRRSARGRARRRRARPTAARATISRDLVEDRHDLAVVVVAVDREQHARLDLAEAVDHALHAEVRRARGEDRAARRRAQHRDDRLRHVRHVGRDAVACARCRAPRAPRERATRAHAARRATAAARTLSSPQNTSASPSSSARLRSSRFCAKLRRASGKPARARHAIGVDQHALAGRRRSRPP